MADDNTKDVANKSAAETTAGTARAKPAPTIVMIGKETPSGFESAVTLRQSPSAADVTAAIKKLPYGKYTVARMRLKVVEWKEEKKARLIM